MTISFKEARPAVLRAARRVGGPVFSARSRIEREEILNDIYTEWAFIQGEETGEQGLLLSAREILRERLPAFRAEVPVEAMVGFQPVAEEVPLVMAEAEKEGAEILTTLQDLERGDLVDQTRAALIKMHLGFEAVPGQPKKWLNRLRYDRRLQQTVSESGPALLDFGNYHGLGAQKKGPCPTCTAIVKFYRVPGLRVQDVSELMRMFAVKERIS